MKGDRNFRRHLDGIEIEREGRKENKQKDGNQRNLKRPVSFVLVPQNA